MTSLLFFFFSVFTTLVLTLSLNSTSSTPTVWRVVSKVNVLLRLQSNHERWNVDDSLTDGNVSLSNQHSSVVDRSSQTQFENLSLQSSLQEIFWFQSQDVIQLHLVLWQHTNLHQSSDQSITFEQSLWVLLVSGQQVTSGSSDLGQLELNSVDFSLVLQSKFTSQLQFTVQTGRLIWSLWHRVGLRVSSWGT
ncbi:40S ribosomal protein S9-B [Meyerozyma guilliermondii ATCC 6260]|uniref:40S ribosomal protein S9-B n=1 Tax=Meyerozyma guilliermondii (strain ATCC 6260 / CBS 566 / DSM 6381 / JCM 1539 / NBRC 10279 / NRRL Y-324) TaxID=294746 RepID=A5DK91_PICGU|nr:40S ribosomal protein S9-B [Meyerozyma guilliermondii ATCC 6260]EDK39594.2 40S ribosomal protein S9-B [Meyerozyma guilliermondii ATCC 6260]